MTIREGLVRLDDGDKERLALMCLLFGFNARAVARSVGKLEGVLVTRYGEPREADAPRSVMRLWWYGLVSASGPLRGPPPEEAARAESLLFLGHLNAHAGAKGWRVLSEGPRARGGRSQPRAAHRGG